MAQDKMRLFNGLSMNMENPPFGLFTVRLTLMLRVFFSDHAFNFAYLAFYYTMIAPGVRLLFGSAPRLTLTRR